MRFDILVIEPDIGIAENIANIIENHEKSPPCKFVPTGLSAMEYLKKDVAFLVITEFVLPDMDAFTLLDFVNYHCPEIPVMVIANEVKPRTREILKKKGVVDFLLKPLDANFFAGIYDKLHEKVQSGGSVTGVSLDAFVQMIEMEQKSYILRVFHMQNGQCGALFFQDGELVHARIVGDTEDGITAAVKILSWQPISLLIENEPTIPRRSIHMNLQALLMEAMRLRDENDEEQMLSGTVSSSSAMEPAASNHWLIPLPFDAFYARDPSPDYHKNTIFDYGEVLGRIIGGGELVACYFCARDGIKSLVSPKNEDLSIILPPSCDRKKLLRFLEAQLHNERGQA